MIPGRPYALEAYLHPATTGEIARCVLAHPHPQFGGSMDNNVVVALAEKFPGRGITTLRFNFRGVGRSEGEFGNVTGEAKDIGAALGYLREDTDLQTFVAAYSFGATAASFFLDENPDSMDAFAMISPPVGFPGLEPRFPKSTPLFIICGDRDNFCPTKVLSEHLEGENRPMVIQGADHFWLFGIDEMARSVCDFFLSNLD